MRNRIISFLNVMAYFLTGTVLGSLWIVKSDTWQYTLPICLICITLSNSLNNNHG